MKPKNYLNLGFMAFATILVGIALWKDSEYTPTLIAFMAGLQIPGSLAEVAAKKMRQKNGPA